MTKLELMEMNKRKLHEVWEEINNLEDGLEKDVKMNLITQWIKGNKWMGGISDSTFQKIMNRLVQFGYTEIQIMEEFDRQMEQYV